MAEQILGCGCWFSLNSGPNGECEKCGRVPCVDVTEHRNEIHSVGEDGTCTHCKRIFRRPAAAAAALTSAPSPSTASECQLCKSRVPITAFMDAKGHIVAFESASPAWIWIPCSEKDRMIVKTYEEKLRTA